MRRPDFLFIGPDKTGSSWLYEILRQHPDCHVPEIKDIYFFDRYYDRGLDWYLRQFHDAPEAARAVGELSHDYLFSPEAARRIHDDLPGVRLLTCLRHPVERTFSHYLYLVRSGLTREPFGKALDAFPELIRNSRYATHLEPWRALFDETRLKVLLFDDLVADSRAFAHEVFDHLGVPFIEELRYGQAVLPASRPRSHALARLAKTGANLARDLGLENWVGVLKRGTLARVLYRAYERDEKPLLDPDARARLARLFAPEVDRIEDWLRRDLSRWRI